MSIDLNKWPRFVASLWGRMPCGHIPASISEQTLDDGATTYVAYCGEVGCGKVDMFRSRELRLAAIVGLIEKVEELEKFDMMAMVDSFFAKYADSHLGHDIRADLAAWYQELRSALAAVKGEA